MPSSKGIVMPSSKGIRKTSDLHAARLKKLKAYRYHTRKQLMHACEHGALIDQQFWVVWAVPTSNPSLVLPTPDTMPPCSLHNLLLPTGIPKQVWIPCTRLSKIKDRGIKSGQVIRTSMMEHPFKWDIVNVSGPMPPLYAVIFDPTYNQHYPLLWEEYSAALGIPKEWKVMLDLKIKQLLHNPGVHM
eukprot:7807866-Ditylum_brightwellii.AAC.1